MVVNNFLQNLQQLMDANGVTQVELARAIDIKQASVSAWFTRKTIPSHTVIDKISEFFKVEIHYLFMKPGTQADTRPIESVDEFSLWINEMAEKHLSEKALRSWKHSGSPNEFVRFLRTNYETEDKLWINDWYLPLRDIVAKYATHNLHEKISKLSASRNEKKEVG